ncbi:MAG TPA: (2Fe-2S)-binding protein [Halanaerobiales bacterium]|nr:(2Fe-2S)-binding protein [Halanaerobiales bacterium]
MEYKIKFTVNGEKRTETVTPSMRLLDLLRDDLGLTGAKEGCGQGECGACSVIMDGKLVASCLILAAQADGSEIITVEGVKKGNDLHQIQKSFIEAGAVQCGFCTPGMIMATKNLLDKNPDPSSEEIKRGLSGNICRCTGYAKIFDAVKMSAKKLQSEGSENNA